MPGKDQVKGLRDGLGDKAGMIIADKSYEVSDPTNRLGRSVALHDSGADIFFLLGCAEGIGASHPEGVGELGWKPEILSRQHRTVGVGAGASVSRLACNMPRTGHLHGLSEGSDRSGMEGRCGA